MKTNIYNLIVCIECCYHQLEVQFLILVKPVRKNVGNFIAHLINNDDLWNMWKGQMPVIYNKLSED